MATSKQNNANARKKILYVNTNHNAERLTRYKKELSAFYTTRCKSHGALIDMRSAFTETSKRIDEEIKYSEQSSQS